MKKPQPQEKHQRVSAHENRPPHDPYWLRAHKDWRFLAVVFLMLAAMGTYVVLVGYVWQPHRNPVPLVDAGGSTR